MPDKVLFTRSDVKLAGPGRLMLASAIALRDCGVEVQFATGGGAMVDQIEDAGFLHTTLPELQLENRSLPGTGKAAIRLLRLCRQQKFSAVHAFNAHAALCALPATKLARIPLFNTVLGNGKENLLRKLPLSLVAVSQSVKDNLISHGIPADRIRVIYNSTLDSRFILDGDSDFEALRASRQSKQPVTFVSVAIFTGHKGHREIVEAAKAYVDAGYPTPIRIRFVGDGPKQSEIADLADTLGIRDMFEFIGASNVVENHLRDSHVFIHLSEKETFGMVLAEANGLGLPCIANDVGGIPEVIEDGETGFLVDRLDPAGVARRMDELARSEPMRSAMGRAGMVRAADLFSLGSMSRDLMELYGLAKKHDG